MDFLKNVLQESTDFTRIQKEIAKPGSTIGLTGLSDIHKSHFIHSITDSLSHPAMLIAHDESSAQKMSTDLSLMGSRVAIYPSRDFNFHNIAGQSKEYEHQRLSVLNKLLKNDLDVVIACPDAALQYTIPKNKLKDITFTIKTGTTIAICDVAKKLIGCGYEKYDQVEGEGQFSVRGGILDFFTTNSNKPVRIEFWGDEIDSIHYFDIATQRRTESIKQITISPANEIIIDDPIKLIENIQNLKDKLKKEKYNQKSIDILSSEIDQLQNTGGVGSCDKFINFIYDSPNTLFDYLDKNSLIFVSEQTKVEDRLKSTAFRWQEDLSLYLEDGVLCKGLDTFSADKTQFLSYINERSTLYFDTFLTRGCFSKINKTITINARQLPIWNGSLSLLSDDLSSMSKNQTVIVLAGTKRSAMSTAKDLQQRGINITYLENVNDIAPGSKIITTGSLSAGFEYPDINFSLITYGYFNTSSKSSIKKKKNNRKSVYSISDLNIGDYVVHSLHGIGVFKGIHNIEVQNVKKDYIKIAYAKGDTLYVPVTQLDLVDKYIGPASETRVHLNKLGSTEWQKSKARVKKATKDIAKELIKLYSDRMHTKGYAFPEDNELQRDFESHFEYEETPDQLRCIDEIKADMQKVAPMDRLLCGDVGFGKTEVALRAAFKCVCNSKQCAILVPTTILAWQHFQTIVKRFENFPIKIELLSRFRTQKQQTETLKRLKRGEVDIIVGTHRLVQKDVFFYDLGLVIIDEEQRFGVSQKERFKELAKNVDVLTLSATPIPRTLNMAMSGIRDMSSLEEAPQNRFPVQTYILEHDQTIINEAIRRELRRAGQVYYMHNNVSTISQTAASLQNQIPEAKVGYAHGKMSEQELSSVWQKVVEHEIDILVCTTIIETGIDVANVNTLIIENADHLGLSQLHQIRGRVGRSGRRAFAYFTYKRSKILSEISQKRLSAIREFTEFGSGFKIAMRDLELRGAGNILGGEQHGHMADVGYDLYLKLLGQAVSEEKGEPILKSDIECLVDVQIGAHIPEKYIPNVNQRIDIYRRISDIRSKEDASDVTDELIDRFGEPPESVLGLIDVAIIRSTAASLGIYEIRQQNNKFLLFADNLDEKLLEKFIKTMGSKITIKSSGKPHICVNIDKENSIINNLKEILSIS